MTAIDTREPGALLKAAEAEVARLRGLGWTKADFARALVKELALTPEELKAEAARPCRWSPPLRVHRDEGGHVSIRDAKGEIVAAIPAGRNIWEWGDHDAAQLVAAANALYPPISG
jgi:hypothetical protein